nr:aldehyde dehydrogenase family protein [Pseudarthrobacter psychrotolerans]
MLKGERSEQVSNGVDVHSVRQPVGVVACITPFNFPAMVPLWMIGSALACGNTVLLKPSEKDPSSAVFIAEVFAEAGLPAGVLNVVHGDKEAVDVLLEHPDVKAVSFVGSTPIAQSIYKRAADNGSASSPRRSEEPHGGPARRRFGHGSRCGDFRGLRSAGERCMAVSVLVAVGNIADDLVAAITSRMATLKIGPGTDPSSQMGPLITAEHRDRVASYVAGAENEGATVVVDGRTLDFDSNGFFIGVSLVDHVKPGMKVYDDEIFGPVLSVVRVASYSDAVRLVNENEFGNGVPSSHATAAPGNSSSTSRPGWWVSTCRSRCRWDFSFGGWKNSLFGDTHMYGPEASASTRGARW